MPAELGLPSSKAIEPTAAKIYPYKTNKSYSQAWHHHHPLPTNSLPPPPSKAMEESHLLPFFRTLFAIFLLGLLARRHVEATEYTVGEEDGWDTGTNYLIWSQKYNFSVGDVLVFKYAIGQHDACQVKEETFRSCDSTSGVVKTYSSGLDRVKLTEAGKYWFICSVKGHCQAGMKFGLSVASASPDGGIDAAPPPGGDGGLAPPPPEQGSGAAGEGVGRWKIAWLLGLAVGGLFLLNC